VTDDELERIDQMADARTVDAEVRADLHRLAADWRRLRKDYFKAMEDANPDLRMERDDLREKIREYVRERQDAAVLGPDRCNVDRYFAKLEQLA
jgi:regulator of replication initiation timing